MALPKTTLVSLLVKADRQLVERKEELRRLAVLFPDFSGDTLIEKACSAMNVLADERRATANTLSLIRAALNRADVPVKAPDGTDLSIVNRVVELAKRAATVGYGSNVTDAMAIVRRIEVICNARNIPAGDLVERVRRMGAEIDAAVEQVRLREDRLKAIWSHLGEVVPTFDGLTDRVNEVVLLVKQLRAHRCPPPPDCSFTAMFYSLLGWVS